MKARRVTGGFVSPLHGGHLIGATEFVDLNFHYAACAVIGEHELVML